MNEKRKLYENFFERMSAAKAAGFNLEASWYCYAIIEDRLTSLLRSSGGVGQNVSARPIRMLGPKLKELKQRANNNALLKSLLPSQEIHDWKEERNDLMHAMAGGSLTIEEIDKRAYLLITNGEQLVKQLAASAMRMKKHGNKVN